MKQKMSKAEEQKAANRGLPQGRSSRAGVYAAVGVVSPPVLNGDTGLYRKFRDSSVIFAYFGGQTFR